MGVVLRWAIQVRPHGLLYADIAGEILAWDGTIPSTGGGCSDVKRHAGLAPARALPAGGTAAARLERSGLARLAQRR